VEGQHINRSLLALGNCINALATNTTKYVNFRDSKLTRLLRESLDGRCRTLMICCTSPASLHYEETYNTLNYANRAKNIKTSALTNDEVLIDTQVSEYAAVIAALRKEVATLRMLARRPSQQQPFFSSILPFVLLLRLVFCCLFGWLGFLFWFFCVCFFFSSPSGQRTRQPIARASLSQCRRNHVAAVCSRAECFDPTRRCARRAPGRRFRC
jgi:hypothetical protein